MVAAVSGCGSMETNGTETIVSETEETAAESTEKGTEATEEATEETTEAVTEEATEKSSEVVKSTEKKENVKSSEVAKSTEKQEEVKPTEAQKPEPAPAPTEKQEEVKPTEISKENCTHSWVWGEVIEEPTCRYSGSAYKTCSVCGAVAVSTLPATGEHDFVLTNPEDCWAWAEYECTICGGGYVADWMISCGDGN